MSIPYFLRVFAELILTIRRRLLGAGFLYLMLAFGLPYLERAAYMMHLATRPVPDSFVVPVAGVSRNAVRDSWYAPRDGGRRRHEGIDIFARRGTPVRASTDGVVLRIGSTRVGGRVVWVLGPGGQRHYYAHLDRFGWVHAGLRVEAGTVLGYVGTSGNAAGTPPHLHYGIYTAGGAINPYPVLKASMSPGADRAG